MEDLRVPDIYVAQTLRFWCLHPSCIRACSAVEEGGATLRRIHRSERCIRCLAVAHAVQKIRDGSSNLEKTAGHVGLPP